MALVDPARYSFYGVIRSQQQPTWSPTNDLGTATLQGTHSGHHCTTAPADVTANMAGAHVSKESFDPVSAPQLDVSVPPGRISHEGGEWYTPGALRSHLRMEPDSKTASSQKKPFHRWIRSLHRRTNQRQSVLEEGASDDSLLPPESIARSQRGSILTAPPLSASGSSFQFVSAVRSASVSLASGSAATRTRNVVARSRHLSRTDRSSRVSLSAPRVSEDSVIDQPAIVDAATIERSLQRRRILDELITTEEGYIGDVRFLINVYVTILASLPVLSVSLRSSIKRNLTDVVELHEDILGELHKVVPRSKYAQLSRSGAEIQLPVNSSAKSIHETSQAHRRWRSMDVVRDHVGSSPLLLQDLPSIYADPQIGAEVSRIFAKRMNKFFIYEEYGAKYEIMMKDIASANRTIPEWETYQKGLEALALTLGSVKCHKDAANKSLTVNDLLVKPIQRVCKYPLLFAELLKHTPVCDCPDSHMEIDSALTRLREVTSEINNATNDVHTRAKLEKTWMLQDRLIIPYQDPDAAARSQVRSFGRVQLCGVLHICWQTRDTVEGHYMICLLYENVLCLATAGKVDPVYTILASIHLGGARMEEVDNGRGLQCHTAPFSWKLLFERDYQLYEIMMTACSPKEEMEWRSRLTPPNRGSEGGRDSSTFTLLELEIKSLGNLFGKQGTMARRLSIHRATTVGSKAPLCQVVLKNTSVVRDGAGTSTSGLAINRSQSLITTNTRLPVLTPSRGERARLEGLVSDVWSREILPFPGMASRTRSEHLVRASSVMRKLSVTSLTGSFGKRSGSSVQLPRQIDSWERCDALKVRDSLDLDAVAVTREFAEDSGSVRKLKKPRMKSTHRESLADRMTRLAMVDGAKTASTSSQPGPPRSLDESTTKVGASNLEPMALNDLCDITSGKPSSPAVTNSSKENVYSGPSPAKARSPSRWTKVGGARNNGKGHVFRSLFR